LCRNKRTPAYLGPSISKKEFFFYKFSRPLWGWGSQPLAKFEMTARKVLSYFGPAICNKEKMLLDKHSTLFWLLIGDKRKVWTKCRGINTFTRSWRVHRSHALAYFGHALGDRRKKNVFWQSARGTTNLVGLRIVLKGLAGTNTLAYFGPTISDKE
jgi:hypothetical protein